MARVKGEKQEPEGVEGYLDPHDDFVFNSMQPTLDEVLARWAKTKFSEKLIRARYSSERWEEQRQVFLRYVNREKALVFGKKLAELGATDLMKADRRQRDLGMSLQMIGRGAIRIDQQNPLNSRLEQMGKTLELSARDVAYLIKTGAEIERKAFGMVQQASDVVYAEQFTNLVVQVVNKFVVDPETKRNIGTEVYQALMQQHEALEANKR